MKEINNRRLRNWCFTDYEKVGWVALYEDYKDEIRYMCVGHEICPDTKRPHNQGWIQFKSPKTLRRVKKFVQSNEIHLEGCLGTPKQNSKYCKKDRDYVEFGNYLTQGQRTDLDEIKEMIKKGSNIIDIAEKNFLAWCKYARALCKYKEYCDRDLRKKFRKVEVHHLWGDTGTGKTRMAVESSSDYYKIQGDSMTWFDGYEGESTLIIDEYDNNISCTKLLSLLDGYQLRLPIKGGHTWANWTKVYITSNYKELHGSAKVKHREALARRVTKVIEITQSRR